jgi:hypothetical protein
VASSLEEQHAGHLGLLPLPLLLLLLAAQLARTATLHTAA